MKRFAKIVFVFCAMLALAACKKGDMRVARWNLAASSDVAGSERAGFVSKGERVDLVRTEGARSLVRLADGKEVFVDSKNLYLDAGIFQSGGMSLYQRPSASSGAVASARNIAPGIVFFVKEREKNAEGEWLSIEGGSRNTYFAGWLIQKEGLPIDFDLASVSLGLRLETAIAKKDRAELESLAGESGAIGEAAAKALAELAPAEEEGQDAEGAAGEPAADGLP